MPFQTPQGLEQLMAMFRAMQSPQQQNGGNIQGMMGLQNPFGAGPQQQAFPNMQAPATGAPPPLAPPPGGQPPPIPSGGVGGPPGAPIPGAPPPQMPQMPQMPQGQQPAQPGQLPISQYGFGGETRFHQPFQFKWPEIKKPVSTFSRLIHGGDDSGDSDGSGGDDDDDDDGNGGGGGSEA